MGDTNLNTNSGYSNTNPGYNPNVQDSRLRPPIQSGGKPAGQVENKKEVDNRRISDVAKSNMPSPPVTPPTKNVRITNLHNPNPSKYTPTPYKPPVKEAEPPRARSTPGAAYIPPSGKKLEPLKPGSLNPKPAVAEINTTEQKHAPLPKTTITRTTISIDQENKINGFNEQEIDLISGADPSRNLAALGYIRNERHGILKSIVDAVIQGTPANPRQEQVDIDLAEAVGDGLAHLEDNIKDQKLKQLVANLRESFTEKLDHLRPEDLQTYREALEAIDSAVLHQSRVDVLMQPHQIAARRVARKETLSKMTTTINNKEVENKSNALQKILDTYDKLKPGSKILKPGSKINFNAKTQQLETKKRKFDPLSKFTTSKEGTSEKAKDAYFSILNELSHLPDNEGLKTQAKQIFAKLEADTRFKAACDTHPILNSEFAKVKEAIEKK